MVKIAALALLVPCLHAYDVVKPGTHPAIVFSQQELPALRARAKRPGMAADAYQRVRQEALADYPSNIDVKAAVHRQGEQLAQKLISMALVYQVEQDRQMGRQAVELFKTVAIGLDPWAFFKTVDSDFFATEHWPKAFAFAWDWLYPLFTPEERASLLKSLAQWNAALFDHTEHWWWRDASINCGAIPVGAQGLLLTALDPDLQHPDAARWRSECFRRIRDNYYPGTWRANGFCSEGPGYAHYHRNPTQFADAVRRTGGQDIIPQSGAVNAMHYLRHQWMPQGGCGPVGDNTEYGRRVFQGIYLFGIREMRDRAGLWTLEHFTDRPRIDPVEIFLYYPDDLQPASPGELDLPVSYYFEFDQNRAGTVFARDSWDNEQANWFAFVTRYAEANHTHTDMNSFLFTAFGEAFATHANIYPYTHKDHGVDFEHNLVIIDEGGAPAADSLHSAGDDGSINGFLTGVGLGHLADYVRGDAHLSYQDRSVRSSTPARRADRSVLFVKQGPNPYVVVADEIQKDEAAHDYHWQWYTEAHELSGEGTVDKPYLIEGRNARCGISFLEPATPNHDFKVVESINRRRPTDLGLLRVNQHGVEARYLAVAAAWRKDARAPRISRAPGGFAIQGEGFRDLVVTKRVSSGPLETDGLMALVRTDERGRVLGYVLGDGHTLKYRGKMLVQSPQIVSVSADAKLVQATGARQALEGKAPLPATGSFWLPQANTPVLADGQKANGKVRRGMFSLPLRGPR